MDKNAPSETLYYRLTQVDFTNEKTYSNIINIAGENEKNILVYPNPFTKEVTIHVSSEQEEEYSIYVTNTLGQVISTQESILGNQLYYIGKEFSTGVYFLRIVTSSGTTVIKLNKE